MVNIKSKKIFYLLSIIILILVLNPMILKGQELKVFDEANLFSSDELKALDLEANKISETYNMDIIIVTTDDAQGKTSREYADDYYDYNGLGIGSDADGILFLIDMDNSEAYISVSGLGMKYITDLREEKILDTIFDSGLAEGDFYGGAKGFLSASKEYLEIGIPANQYSEDGSAKENTLTFMEGIISLVSGGLASTGFFFRTKSKYKMKNPVKVFNFRENSNINLESESDLFIDSVTTHRAIPKASENDSGKTTTHTSSSGKTHSGGGRKF